MKKTIILYFLIPVLWMWQSKAETHPFPIYMLQEKGINPYLPYWEAVKYQETGNNPWRVNWEEMAFGPGQIRQCKLDDFNKANGKLYTLIDCFSESVSREVFIWHCLQFPDIETAIKRWNGSGPATDVYWSNILILK